MARRKVTVRVLTSFPVNYQYQAVGTEIKMDEEKAKKYEGRGRVEILKAKRARKGTKNRAVLKTEK